MYLFFIHICIRYICMGYGHNGDPYHGASITQPQLPERARPETVAPGGRKTDPQGDPQDESWPSNYWAPLAGVDGLK